MRSDGSKACVTWESERKTGLTCELIISSCDKYSCSLSVQPAVEVEGGMWVCVRVCVIMCLDLCLYMMFWSSPLRKDDRVTCSPTNPPVYNGVYFQKEGVFEGVLRSLSLTLFISFVFIIEQCFLSIFPLISLLLSHSLLALFSLCGKCQVCRWCYLHENGRTKATGWFLTFIVWFDI